MKKNRMKAYMENGDTEKEEPINSENRIKVQTLLTDRACYLNRIFLATPEEVSRLEAMNEMLLKKVEDMKARAAMLGQTILTMKQMPEFDDDYYVSAELRV